MRIGKWARLLLAATPFLAGCGNFWQSPTTGTTSFALSNSGTIVTAPAGTSSNTATITVTPSNSFTGTVSLSCAVTSTPSSATSPTTCSLSSTSVTISDTSAQTATLTATTTSTTTLGDYTITVTGTSGSVSETTSVCVDVTTATTGTCTSTATTSGNFYVLSASSIAGYNVSSGTLNAISGSGFSWSGATASAIAISPSGNFLYVATTNGIILFTINTSTGALTQGNVIFEDAYAGAIQVDPSGKWLLDASAAGTLNAIPILTGGTQDSSRSLQTMSLASTNIELGAIAVSPSGHSGASLIAVGLGTTGTQLFPFTASSSTPIGAAYSPTIKPYGSSGAAIAVAIDPQNRLLYIGETAAFNSSTNSGALRAYSIGANSVGQLTNSPYAPAGTGVHAILPDATGAYVYVASWQGSSAGVVTGYTVSTSALAAISTTVATGNQPNGLAEDNTSSFVLGISSATSSNFNAYTFGSGGVLSSSVSGSAISDPIAIVAAPQ